MDEQSEIFKEIKKKPSRLRYIIDVAIPILTIAALLFILLTHEPKPDPASEKIIREAAAAQLDKDPNELTDEDFIEIKEFTLSYKELSDIKLLAKFVNLQKLHLKAISFPDNKIPAWKKIPENYGFCNLCGNIAIDLSPLEKLINLQELHLGGPAIKNIKPLAGLVNLKNLYLSNTRVSNLEPIKNLTELQMLTIQDSPVFDLEPIKNLTKLQALYLLNCTNILNEEIDDLKNAIPNLFVTKHIISGPRI